ncbi:hypothetical protein GP475_12005 [Corynebacterium poyangense]|uniref:Uncharacterized protein n=1 Tax=Corynebacterium poyangense TaxID=2684405 RepID=A0A7H0SRV1_9CORY|nr:hypothetical protein [Corynebacterium poyangense]MBZ8177215.1 hypothetical protein [Corynebacterium poyangense]QNQ91276.1 hypothetical protein GP475_12005 [Corynebacterium poyangense]
MNTLTFLTMCSVFLGFLCIMAAFWGFMRSKPKKLLIALGLAALVFVTIIPVIIALTISAPKL